jgi:hypothetical protein
LPDPNAVSPARSAYDARCSAMSARCRDRQSVCAATSSKVGEERVHIRRTRVHEGPSLGDEPRSLDAATAANQVAELAEAAVSDAKAEAAAAEGSIDKTLDEDVQS